MNQGKLEVIKQEMARTNVDILGISELKWTGMGEFNSDDHYIYYCGQESLRRNGVAIMVNKRVRNAVLGCNLKNNRMISVSFQGKPFNITLACCSPWGLKELDTTERLHSLTHSLTIILNGLPWKQTEIILLFLRLHPSTSFRTLLLTVMALHLF